MSAGERVEGRRKERDGRHWVLSLQASIPPLQAGILGEVSGEGSSRLFTSSQV